jgi:hypothetical protein
MGRTSRCRVVGDVEQGSLGTLVCGHARRGDGGALERRDGELLQQTRHDEDEWTAKGKGTVGQRAEKEREKKPTQN